jgi:hypothetical protein
MLLALHAGAHPLVAGRLVLALCCTDPVARPVPLMDAIFPVAGVEASVALGGPLALRARSELAGDYDGIGRYAAPTLNVGVRARLADVTAAVVGGLDAVSPDLADGFTPAFHAVFEWNALQSLTVAADASWVQGVPGMARLKVGLDLRF